MTDRDVVQRLLRLERRSVLIYEAMTREGGRRGAARRRSSWVRSAATWMPWSRPCER